MTQARTAPRVLLLTIVVIAPVLLITLLLSRQGAVTSPVKAAKPPASSSASAATPLTGVEVDQFIGDEDQEQQETPLRRPTPHRAALPAPPLVPLPEPATTTAAPALAGSGQRGPTRSGSAPLPALLQVFRC